MNRRSADGRDRESTVRDATMTESCHPVCVETLRTRSIRGDLQSQLRTPDDNDVSLDLRQLPQMSPSARGAGHGASCAHVQGAGEGHGKSLAFYPYFCCEPKDALKAKCIRGKNQPFDP